MGIVFRGVDVKVVGVGHYGSGGGFGGSFLACDTADVG